jgi:YaiO family outer membrane protein
MTDALRRVVLPLILIVAPVLAAAQESSDEMFERARQLAFSGEREEARALCLEILERHPDHWDARILLGRLYAWDKRFDEARRELTRVVEARPDYADGRSALIDVELWSDHPEAALALAEEGLALEPEDSDFEFARARAYAKLKQYEESAEAAERTLALDPDHEQAKRLLRRVYDNILGNRATAEYEYESFDDDLDSWHLLYLQYRRAYGFGSILYRLNLARRFGDNGAQIEIDSYPTIRAGTYLYLNLGLSGSDLFPDFRLGGEVYQAIRGGWEASGGFRYLDFGSSDVTIVTGTAAKYKGDHWIQFRPSYVIGNNTDSFSGHIEYRRYFGGRYEWAGVTVGGGVKNEENVVSRQDDELDSFRISLRLRKKITHKFLLRANLGYREQEFPNDTRKSWLIGAGIERFF